MPALECTSTLRGSPSPYCPPAQPFPTSPIARAIAISASSISSTLPLPLASPRTPSSPLRTFSTLSSPRPSTAPTPSPTLLSLSPSPSLLSIQHSHALLLQKHSLAARWGAELRAEREGRVQATAQVRAMERRWREEREEGGRVREEVARMREEMEGLRGRVRELEGRLGEERKEVGEAVRVVGEVKAQLTKARRQAEEESEEGGGRGVEREGVGGGKEEGEGEGEGDERKVREGGALDREWRAPTRVVFEHAGVGAQQKGGLREVRLAGVAVLQPPSPVHYFRRHFFTHNDMHEWGRRRAADL